MSLLWGGDEEKWEDGRGRAEMEVQILRHLENVSVIDEWHRFTHERLGRARSSLSRLMSVGTLFTCLDPEYAPEGPLPHTNNTIKGGANARLRDMLRNHRGMSLMRKVKVVF